MKIFGKWSVLFFLGLFGFNGTINAKVTNENLQIGISQEFENLNPLFSTMVATGLITSMSIRSLMVLDEKNQWYPQIIKKIPNLKDGSAKKLKKPTGEEYIVADYEIKKNANWGDGAPLTGEDVKFSWEVALDPNVGVDSHEFYEKIEQIEIDPKNPKKFRFIFKKSDWNFFRMEGFDVIPKHLEKPIFDKFGSQPEGYSKNSKYSTDPTNPGLYNGPYKISQIVLGSHVTLVPNDHFYGKKPKIKKITFKLIPNTGTLEANLRSGNIDMISTVGLSLDQALVFDKKVKAEKMPFKVNFIPGQTYEHIDLQLKNPYLADIKVRKALIYATDRKKLSDSLFEGKQKPALHFLTPFDPCYTEDSKKIVKYESDKKKATQLLEEAGWKMGPDGYRRNQKGEKLSFQINSTAGNKIRELIEVYLQGEWKKVGIELTIKNEPPRVFFAETKNKSNYSAMALYANVSTPEQNKRSAFHSHNIPNQANNYAGDNSMNWVNPEVDKLIEKIESEFDQEKRKALMQKILFHYTNDVPVLPLFYKNTISVIPSNMVGYKETGHSFSAHQKVEEWYFQ